MIILLSFFIPIIIILRLTGEGEVFYIQKRVGLYGKIFGLFKFATMLKNSPNIGSGTITTAADPRVLPLGKFLRKTKINELPQIFNVIRGDLSLVGPRPQTQECFDFFPMEYQNELKTIKPGVTGIGSIIFRDEEAIIGASKKKYDDCYREDIMPFKARLELWYKNNASIFVDCIILFSTGLVIIFPNSNIMKYCFKNLPTR